MKTILHALATLFLFAGAAGAQTVQPWNPPTGFADDSYLQSPVNGRPLLFNGTSSAANWQFSAEATDDQCDMSAPTHKSFLGGSVYQQSCGWVSAAYIARSDGLWTVQMHYDGSAAQCYLSDGATPSEHDIFFSPNATVTGQSYPTALNTSLYQTNASFPTMDQLASITLSGTLAVHQDKGANYSSPCLVNKGAAQIGITLVDNAVTPVQMFWYIIGAARICQPNVQDTIPDANGHTGAAYASCVAGQTSSTPGEYWTGPAGSPSPHVTGSIVNYGWGDPLTNYGVPTLTAPGRVKMTLNVASRIDGFITAGGYGMDTNLADWRIAGFNFGQANWGEAEFGTGWTGFVPSWTLK